MPEIIQDWLGTRLGVLLDITPQNFGRNTKDGKLLAKLLYSYGVIPLQVLEKFQDCHTCYECYNNLAILKPYLTYIGVVHDDSTLTEMSRGNGSASISIFYAVYLHLERKDRLRYISVQRERRVTDVSCSRFKVDWVPEKAIRENPVDVDPLLAMPLVKQRDIIDFHREKCKEVVERIKRAKTKFHKIKKKETKLGPVISKSASSQPLDKRKMEIQNTIEDINKFSRNHPEPCRDLNYSQLVELKNKYENADCFSSNFSQAKIIISNIKRRKKGEVYAQNFQQKMQQLLLDEQWKQVVERQDRNFEDSVCANLLKQSQYEKQMATKLHLIKHQKKVMAENRKKLECLKIEQRHKEYDELVMAKVEMRGESFEEEAFEKERIAELHRRLYYAKVRERKDQLRKECRKICEAFVDIAIRISEIREQTGCQIPKAFMKDMKELFFKDFSIFDLLDHFEELCEENQIQMARDTECFGDDSEGEYVQVDSGYEELKRQEMERQNALNECDLRDYLELLGPWMVELFFPDSSETEGKHSVLGYIVHRLLETKYPVFNPRSLMDIKPMKPVVAIQGLNDENAVDMLSDLMELRNILVVRIQDAINFVLLAYKEELSAIRDIDITFQVITSNALKERPSVKEREEKRKVQLLKKSSPETSTIDEEYSLADKQTQTPRMIPDDPILSPNAEIGKLAFEALGSGDPVPDPIIVSAICAYVKSKEDDCVGWVLINYPLLYSQASELEYSLLGYRVLPVLDNMSTLEDVEGFTYRRPWAESFSQDVFGSNRESRLVPKPECLVVMYIGMPKTYFHAFIRMKKVPASPYGSIMDRDVENSLMEAFYSEQDILFDFEYQSLNFQTLKNLGKTICERNDSDFDIVTKTSIECFGDAILDLNEKWDPKKKTSKEFTRGPKKFSKEVSSPIVSEISDEIGEGEEELKKSVYEPAEPPKPGDPNWKWAEGPQPEEYLIALAGLWENMEAVYLEDFKNVFFCLRIHRANVIHYSKCVRQSVRSLMRRPDEKQKLLSDFQRMFNDLDLDLRPDVDIKCELHVRVSELEQALMALADERKMNSQNDMNKIAQNGWVPDEIASLTNTYLTALQLEADRCVDSVQVIMDYYTLMQQKIPDEKPLEKIVVPKLQIRAQKYSVTSGTIKSSLTISPKSSDIRRGKSEQSKEKVSKTRSLQDKRRRSSDGSVLPGAAEFITDILTSLTLPEDGLTPFHNFFIDNVDIVTNDVKSLLEACLAETKKNEKPPLNLGKPPKNGKKMSETMLMSTTGNMFAEWSSALETEMSRFFFRARLLLARGIFDMNEFLTKILNILSSLSDEITGMYMKEIHSISECCKVFRCSIEEEKSVIPLLELKEDEFIVHMNVEEYQNDHDSSSTEAYCQNQFMFSMDQLSSLRSKLQMVAPDGEIVKRSLMYIFQDLQSLNSEMGLNNVFSPNWFKVKPDIVDIMDKIFLHLEIVNWKDFIIYALDLPVPSDTEILNTRSDFRKYDPHVTELISRDCYEKVKFWFDEYLRPAALMDRYERARNLLFEMYQVNENQTNYSALLLALCKDEDPVNGFVKALTLVQGKPIYKGSVTSSIRYEAGEYTYEDFRSRTSSEWSEASAKSCCPPGITTSCVPKERIRCTCGDVETSLSEEGAEDEGKMEEQGGEDATLFLDSPCESRTSFISFDILTSLIKASFPSLSQLSVLLDCSQTLQETLNSVYDSLEPIGGKIEVGKLIRHKFIDRLLHSTNKFKYLSLFEILQGKDCYKPQAALCPSDRLDITKCFL